MTSSADLNMETMRENASRAGGLLKVMSNQNRLMILCHLLKGEKSVTELQEAIGISQSAISQQLAILRGEKLVRTRRDAQQVFYSLASREAEEVIGTLYRIYCD